MAFISEMFHLDPAELLEETDPLKVGVRAAAYRVIAEEHEKQRKKS